MDEKVKDDRLRGIVFEVISRVDGLLFIHLDYPFMTLIRWAGYFLSLIGIFLVKIDLIIAGALLLIALGVNAISRQLQMNLEEWKKIKK